MSSVIAQLDLRCPCPQRAGNGFPRLLTHTTREHRIERTTEPCQALIECPPFGFEFDVGAGYLPFEREAAGFRQQPS
jgi:hypothetical protein